MQYYINNIGKTALYTYLSDLDLQLFCLYTKYTNCKQIVNFKEHI